MTAPAVTPRPSPKWRTVLLALGAFVLLPLLPTALQLVLPVTQTMVLLVAAVAVCALLGWWRGGSTVLALVWVALAGWMLLWPLGWSPGSYGVLARGWVLLLAAAFGVASLLAPEHPFFTRALTAVGIAVAAAFALAVGVPDGIGTVQTVMATEYAHRADLMVAGFERTTALPEWRRVAERYPMLDSMAAQNEAELQAIPARSATVLPALLALESLAALALAWAVYHRLAETPIGAPLGALRDFRFNDQLIWGLAVGATIFFLPAFAPGRHAGLNLLLFFGALYLLRGVGVLSWISRGRGVATVLVILTAIAPPLAAALALGVGVGDTWMDWRSRVPSAT